MITAVATQNDWKVPKVHMIHDAVSPYGYEVDRVAVLELCQPHYAGKILAENRGKVVTSMMPCRVSVCVRRAGRLGSRPASRSRRDCSGSPRPSIDRSRATGGSRSRAPASFGSARCRAHLGPQARRQHLHCGRPATSISKIVLLGQRTTISGLSAWRAVDRGALPPWRSTYGKPEVIQ